MKPPAMLAASALLAWSATAQATPITWSFIETSCTPTNSGRPCAPFTAPLATLILPDTTSTGSASWTGVSAPILTGDANFSFIPVEGNQINPPAYGTQQLCAFSPGPGAICNYTISWDEVAGQLLGIKIDYLTASIAELHLGLIGGRIASDYTIGGCPVLGTCNVTGFWQDSVAVPEPSTASLFVLSLLAWGQTLLLWRFSGRRPKDQPQ